MSAKIEPSEPAIRAALQASSPSQATELENQFRDALTRAASTPHLSQCQSLLDRWWGGSRCCAATPHPRRNSH